MSVQLEVSGLDEAITAFDGAEDRLIDAISDEFELLAPQIEDWAKNIAPVKTGAYRESIYCFVDGPTLQLGTLSEYGSFIEYGTIGHIIEPVVAKALHFFTEAGEEVFADWVWHPGTFPFPVLHDALMAHMLEIDLAINRAIAAALQEEEAEGGEVPEF